jgi:hypothetical protein
MAVPSSGTISLVTHIVGEFGDDGSISLRDYLRGGSLVPDTAANSGVPTSGTLSLRDLLAAEATSPADVTPAAVNWANIGPGTSPQDNANQTISGIDTTITLEVNWTGSGASLSYSIDDGAYTLLANGGQFSVSNSQTVKFRFTRVASGTSSGTATVTNESDGSTSLDTFTYSVNGTGA